MNTQNVTKFIKTLGRGISKHSPEILTGLGIAGMVTTVVLSVKATPKAMQLIEDEKKRIAEEESCEVEEVEKLTPVNTIKVAWKPYIPAVVTGVASVICLVGANSVHARRNAALFSAYKLSETALLEYKEKVEAVVPEKKVKEIKQKIAEDRVKKAAEDDSKVTVIVTGEGDTWFFDPWSNTEFQSSKNKLDSAANVLNRRMRDELFVSLSDFYDEIGLERTATSDSLGWSIDKAYIDVDYSDAIVRDGKAFVVIDFLARPEYNYDKYY